MIRIYLCMQDSIAILERQNTSWHLKQRFQEPAGMPVSHPEPGKARFVPKSAYPSCIAVDPHCTSRIYCGTFGQGLWFSDDRGDTWQQVGKDIPESKVLAVAVSPLESINGKGVVWAGTEPSRLFFSEDGGDSWRERSALQELPSRPNWHFPPRPYTHHVRHIQFDIEDANRLYVSIHEGGVMCSLDRGVTFEDYNPDGEFDPHGLAIHPKAAGRLYVSAGGDEKTAKFKPHWQLAWPPFIPQLVINDGGYAESLDGGDTWKKLTEGLESNRYLWEIAIDPGDPDIIVASAAIGPIQAHTAKFAHSYLVRRAHGKPWERVTDGLPKAKGSLIYELATNPNEPGVFYAANNFGVFRSEDTGLSWFPLNVTWPDRYRNQHTGGIALVQTV